MFESIQHTFAAALLDPEAPVPAVLTSHTARVPERRFAVYRNNVVVGLVNALAKRFPATQRIVGEEFFRAMARLYVTAEPPRSPILMQYGDAFPDFIARFPPAAEIVYLADVARIEAARSRAYHAADVQPLSAESLQSRMTRPLQSAHCRASGNPEQLAHALAVLGPRFRGDERNTAFQSLNDSAVGTLRFVRHPAAEIVRSPHPAVTIWAMNAGVLELGAIEEWRGEDALIARPALDVVVRALPAGGARFLLALFAGQPLAEAAEAAQAECEEFDLTANLAGMLTAGAVCGVKAKQP